MEMLFCCIIGNTHIVLWISFFDGRISASSFLLDGYDQSEIKSKEYTYATLYAEQ